VRMSIQWIIVIDWPLRKLVRVAAYSAFVVSTPSILFSSLVAVSPYTMVVHVFDSSREKLSLESKKKKDMRYEVDIDV